ncbi:MAG: aspartate ammonia-lyase, partial [Clostridiales bacterium]|nr:aspartate ammonia-lyase [Clostridiales bacterium]
VTRIEKAKEGLYTVNMGATAVGTGITAGAVYIRKVVPLLAKITGYPLQQAANLVDATQNTDVLLALSAAVKTCGMNLSKIGNDLRLLSSGPRTGIGELKLPPRQNGSSIMPGKVNPVIPEVVSQAAFRIAGNDLTITMCVEGGQLELNPFEPVLFYSLYESLTLLESAAHTFGVNCIEHVQADVKRCEELVHQSYGMVTALVPVIGYEKAVELVKGSMETGIPMRDYVYAHLPMEKEKLEKITDLIEMTKLPR